ncbi:hypothetical protein CAL19_12695 [Bordetella genomosp. 7]|uniref:Uncharacterized protein n=1 Tax=Bordetella genomosp. 7 TaxID=1416805 RepID=A0A261R0S1_9BORD|nr:hypothetical protein CAL19_12695 [Bordetella genomosp. 7]
MVMVTARSSFMHGGVRRSGDEFEVSEIQAKELVRRGLAMLTEGDVPLQAAGTPLSASPAAQVLPQTIAQPSKRGGRRKKAAE